MHSWESLVSNFGEEDTAFFKETDADTDTHRLKTYLLKSHRPTTVFNHRYKDNRKKKEYPMKSHTY